MTFLEVDSMVVTWWIVALVPSGLIKGLYYSFVMYMMEIGLIWEHTACETSAKACGVLMQ